MRNKLVKTVCLVVVMLLLASTIVGCNNNQSLNPNVTHLYIYNFDGGVGTEWLNEAKTRFEQRYANESFEDGKTGVEIHIQPSKNPVGSVATSPYNIFFFENINVFDMASQDLLLDITDVVKDNIGTVASDVSENKTIESKLNDLQKDSYTFKEDKYYFLPHYETYQGISYNAQVFKEKSLYIKQGGGYTSIESEFSVGPDGIKGSYDDGLPSSYEELYALFDRMVVKNVTPFIWTGAHPDYLAQLIGGAWAAWSGKDQFSLNFNFDSNATGSTVKNRTVTGVSGSGFDATLTISEDIITPTDGYKASMQEGKFYAYQLMQKVLSKSEYISSKITGVLSHLDAQEEYINSYLENKPIAFLIDGSYWYNEASDAIERSIANNPAQKVEKNSNYKWFSFPRQATGQVQEGQGTKNTVVSQLQAYCYINGNIKDDAGKVKAAKTFLKFVYSDEELVNFTLKTGLPKEVDYEISNQQIENLKPFSQHLYEIKKNSDIVYPISSNPIFTNHAVDFRLGGETNFWNVNINGSLYTNVYYAIDNKNTYIEAFNGNPITQNYWQNRYANFLQ